VTAGRWLRALHWHSAYARGRTGRRGPKEGHVEGARSEPQWRAGRESDSAFRRGKEGAGTRARICSAARSGGRIEWPTSGVWSPGPAGREAARCMLREMSRQRARGHVATCGLELGEHAAYARTLRLPGRSSKHLSCS